MKEHLNMNGIASLIQQREPNQSRPIIISQLLVTSKKRIDLKNLAIKKALEYYTPGIVIRIKMN